MYVAINLLIDVLYGVDRSAREARSMTAIAATARQARYVLSRENPVTGFAFALFVLIVLAAVFGPHIVPYDPLASDTAAGAASRRARITGSAPTSSAATCSAASSSRRGSISSSRSPRSLWYS